jgi:protein-tyrosine phosphatase
MDAPISICFVCLGNICRSPTAEGVFLKFVRDAGLEAVVHVDSAGTSAYHVGERADARSREHAAARGYSLTSRARQFVASDFESFDYVLAMDVRNLEDLRALRPERDSGRARLQLFRDFDPTAPPKSSVPDPYYGGVAGFEEVIDQCERAARGLLEEVLGKAPGKSAK